MANTPTKLSETKTADIRQHCLDLAVTLNQSKIPYQDGEVTADMVVTDAKKFWAFFSGADN